MDWRLALNVTWIVLNWREVVPLVLGIIFFGLIIAGIVVYTVFLVREIHKNEQQDSFLNAVTHELKTPIASIRLYLETLQTRQLTEAQHQDFYRIMLEDTDRLLGTVEQILKAGEARHASSKKNWERVDFSGDRGGNGGTHAAAPSLAGRGPAICGLWPMKKSTCVEIPRNCARPCSTSLKMP